MIDDAQLAKLLIKERLLDDAALEEARRQQQRHGGDLYSVLIENSFVHEERTITLVARHLNIPCVSLKDFDPVEAITTMIPPQMAASYRVIPLGLSDDQDPPALYLAMADPTDMLALDEIGEHTSRDIIAFLAGPLDIDRTLERCYGRAIYQSASPIDDLLGDSPPSSHNPFSGPSMSQLMDLPRLDDDLEDLDMPMAFSSLSANGTMIGGELPGIEPMPMIPPMTPVLDKVALAEIADASDDEMLEVELEGFGDPHDSELFAVRGSKIFMPPESLSEAGRQRLEEAQRKQGISPAAEDRGNSTSLGMFISPVSDDVQGGGVPLAASAPPEDGNSTSLRSQSSISAIQVPVGAFPRELTNRSVRVLNQAYNARNAAEVFRNVPTRELLVATLALLIEKGLLTEAEILGRLATFHKQD